MHRLYWKTNLQKLRSCCESPGPDYFLVLPKTGVKRKENTMP